jgi:uncharacterized SAM-binding protein YcdF (DUF218 family)
MRRTSEEDDDQRPARLRRRRRLRRWFRLFLFGGIALVLLGALGFVSFADSLPRSETRVTTKTDGIVVLTGGASRIVDAIELLASGHGKRLLISGVNPSTTRDELIRVNPDFERLLDCCIDLGHQATNTIGNAVETARWVRGKNFRSIIVVTSGWHMPRAVIEIENELPDVQLIPYPVVSERMRDVAWWSDAPTIRLLLIEYVKYLASIVRVRLDHIALAGGTPMAKS